MPIATAKAPSPDVPRSFIIIVFGPVIGTIVFYLTVILPNATSSLDDGMTRLYAILAVFGLGWVIGLAPAGMAAIAWTWSRSETISGLGRWLRAIATGAICGVVGGVPGIMLLFGFREFSVQGVLLFALAGAIALVVTVFPGSNR